MFFFDFADVFEQESELVKTLLLGDFGELGVHDFVFVTLALGGGEEVLKRVADVPYFAVVLHCLEPQLCVFLFVVGGGGEDCGDLFVALFFGFARIVGVLVARH